MWPHSMGIVQGLKLIENRHTNMFRRHLGTWIFVQQSLKTDKEAPRKLQEKIAPRTRRQRGKVVGMHF